MQLLANASWTARLLYRADDSWIATARCFGTSLLLAAVFGVALGARHGATAMASAAAGVPLGLAVVAAFGAPAFYVALAHAGVAFDARALAAALASASALTGLVLAELTPAVLLVSVSVDTELGARAAGIAALALAGALGQRRLFRELKTCRKLPARSLEREPTAPRPADEATPSLGERAAWWAFAAFSSLLAARIWWLVLPMIAGEGGR